MLGPKCPEYALPVIAWLLRKNISFKRATNSWFITRDGVTLLSPTSKFVTFGLNYFRRQFERYFPINKDDTALDVGACIGDTTVPMAMKADHVIAVEPHPINAKYLRVNTQEFGNVRLIEKAAYSRRGQIPFYVHSSIPTKHSLVDDEGNTGTMMVEADTLDRIVDEPIDFAKVDVQGCEAEVLRGAPQLLKVTPKIVVETHWRSNDRRTYPEVLQILKQHGFTTKFAWDNGCVYGWRN